MLGVCNGFQILCESHLLPGALARNGDQQFVCKNVFLKGEGYYSVLDTERNRMFNSYSANAANLTPIYKIPIAHGEGRFYADEKTLDDLEANGQVIFRYCDEKGNISRDANPNGAIRNIAGICNIHRNVFGMMPHPERACSEALGNTDGRKILNTLLIANQIVA